MATARRSGASGIASARQVVVTMPANAPTDIKPAWPSDSSPRMPTVRLSEMAMTTYAQMGTSRPLIWLEMPPPAMAACTMMYAMMTMPKHSSVSRPRLDAA